MYSVLFVSLLSQDQTRHMPASSSPTRHPRSHHPYVLPLTMNSPFLFNKLLSLCLHLAHICKSLHFLPTVSAGTPVCNQVDGLVSRHKHTHRQTVGDSSMRFGTNQLPFSPSPKLLLVHELLLSGCKNNVGQHINN